MRSERVPWRGLEVMMGMTVALFGSAVTTQALTPVVTLTVGNPNLQADGEMNTNLTAYCYDSVTRMPIAYQTIQFEADFGIPSPLSVNTDATGHATSYFTTIDGGSYYVYARPAGASWVSKAVYPQNVYPETINQTFPTGQQYACRTPVDFHPAYSWSSRKRSSYPYGSGLYPYQILDWHSDWYHSDGYNTQGSSSQYGNGSYTYNPCFGMVSNTQKFWGELYLARRTYGGWFRYNYREGMSNIVYELVIPVGG